MLLFAKVSPLELENLLLKHPDILDAAVIGITKKSACNETLEKPRAYVVRRSKCLTESNVSDFVAKNVTCFKKLTGGVQFVDKIPKSPSGKILRKDLLKMYELEKN